MTASIPWHCRLEARVVLGVSLVSGVSLVALMLVTGQVVESHTTGRARADLASARDAFTHLVATQAELVAAQTRLITALPVFRAHMSDIRLTEDPATMEAMADSYRQELAATFVIVSNGDGRWLASVGLSPDSAARVTIEPIIAATAQGRSHREILALQGQLVLVVSEPATFADEVLGTVTTGYSLNDDMALRLARTTRYHVALVTGDTISGTSLTGAPRDRLAMVLRTDKDHFAEAGVVSLTRLGDADYVGGAFPLAAAADTRATGGLILLEDWRPTQQFIDQIRQRLLWAGAALFVFATCISLVISRRMSRPLRQLADVAGQIAAGRWDQRVSAGGSAEAVVMADAFNGMTASLTHWHAEACSRAEQLQASYERFYAVTQSAHDGIVSEDAAGAVVFWNRRAAAIFARSEGEALGSVFASLLSDECAERYRDAVRLLSRGTDDDVESQTLEGEGIRRDGSRFPLELALASWKSGSDVCVTVVVRDVTERRRADEMLRLRDQQLQQAQKMEAIGRLASGIAHDVNNSLAVIQGRGEMLLTSLPEGSATRRDLESIVQASHSAAAVTRRLLGFSRKQVSEACLVDPQVLVSGVETMLGRLLGENIEISTGADPGSGHVCVDPALLEHAIMNLAINARDAMPDGGHLTIAIRNTLMADPAVCHRLGVKAGHYVTISVRDTGGGMAPELASRVFEPFFTTKEDGKGTGLGLATVYSFITQSGGQVEVETAVGKGTTFLLHLPRAEKVIEAARVPFITPQRAGAAGGETVLLVEDERPVRAMLKTVLERRGFTVLEATTGAEAIDVADRYPGPIDLVLTDVVMPGLGGFALWQVLSSQRPHTKVVFMTGYPPGSTARQAIDASELPCLQKPFSFDALSGLLRDVLAQQAACA